MKLLVDMNLSPRWVAVFERYGWPAVHWSDVAGAEAADPEIMAWARENGYVVFTHDLDFGTLLALTHSGGPSVIQVRTQDVMPSALEALLLPLLSRYEKQLESGALMTIDQVKARLRILPL